jgi:hypothetical protein
LNEASRKQHADHLCSNCRQRPRKQYPSRLHTYCLECITEKKRKTYKFKGNMHNPNKICSRCKRAPRRIASSGQAYVYCAECVRQTSLESHRRCRKKKVS